MSDYGLRVFDSSGNVKLDTTDTITRLRYSNEVAADASSSTTLTDIGGLGSVEISVAIENTAIYNEVAHLVTRSGTTISWVSQNGTVYNPADSLVFVFLYT